MGRRGLQLVLVVVGLVAVSFGSLSILFGTALIPGEAASSSVDSELRYYAAWYVLTGALVLRAVRRVEAETTLIRWICAALLLGALGRVFSIVAVGRPGELYLALMAIEFVLPVVIVPWQAALARRARS